MVQAAREISSQIDDDVALGLRATDQHIPDRGCIKRVGAVADRPAHKSSLASMADPRSTRPSHRYVAGFSKLEQALERRLPADIESASSERDPRSVARRTCRQVWRRTRRRREARGDGRTWAENLGVNASCSDAPGRKAGSQIIHEGGRSADVEIAVARHAQFLQNAHVHASGSVEIYANSILGSGRAVANVTVTTSQSFEQGLRLLGKCMLAAVAGSMYPPDIPRRCLGCQSVEHREHRGCSDARAQQNDRCVARSKRERTTCRTCIHLVAYLQLIVNISAGSTVGF